MTVKHRKIWWFEYDYEEEKCKDIYDHWTIIESVKHTVIIKETPRWVDWYKDNAELLDFIIALERSWELDKVKTEYIWWNGYGKITTEPKPWTEPYTWTYDDNSNVILCNSNEHDAKNWSNFWKKSFSRTRLSSKDISK